MVPFKGWPDILVIEIPSVFAFNLKFVCFFICLSLISFFVVFFCKKKKQQHFFSEKNDGQI